MEEYSPYKVIHLRQELDDLKEGKQIVPPQVQLIISDKCNLRCSFCAYRNEGYTSSENFYELREDGTKNLNPNRQIPYVKCLEIIDDCANLGVKAIQYTGGGEVTVHPQHVELLQYTLDKGLEIALVTNGVSIKEDLFPILTNAAWVRFSLDAGTKESYKTIKGANAFDIVKKNITTLVESKKAAGTEVVIGVGFVVEKGNYSEIYDATRIVKELGVDNIRISAAFMPDSVEYHLAHYEEAKKQANKAKRDFEDNSFTVFNLFNSRVQDLIDERPEYDFCGYMHFNTYIGGDLKVYTCCNNAYNDLGEVGDLKDKSFREFWLSQEKEDRYRDFDPKKCKQCMFNNKNRFINYCLKDNPRHVNFV